MDVGDHALIRGLGTASPLCVPGLPNLTAGVGMAGHKASDGSFPCRYPAPTPAQPYGRRVDASGGAMPLASASPPARLPKRSLPARAPRP